MPLLALEDVHTFYGDAQILHGVSLAIGADITRWPTHLIARHGITWVPDNRRIFPTLTVERSFQMDDGRIVHSAPARELEADGARLRQLLAV